MEKKGKDKCYRILPFISGSSFSFVLFVVKINKFQYSTLSEQILKIIKSAAQKKSN